MARQLDLIHVAPNGFFGNAPPNWQPPLAALGLEGRDTQPDVYSLPWVVAIAPMAQALHPHRFFSTVAFIKLALPGACVPLSCRVCRAFAILFCASALARVVLFGTSVIAFSAH